MRIGSKSKEGNIVFNSISWLPRFVLQKLRIEVTHAKVALMSFLFCAVVIAINGSLIVALG